MGNMCIAIVCKPGCDVMNSYMAKKLWQKRKYLKNENSF